MTIGPERNAIKNHVMHAAPNMASAKMEPVYAVKDGTEDIAHYVCKVANYVNFWIKSFILLEHIFCNW